MHRVLELIQSLVLSTLDYLWRFLLTLTFTLVYIAHESRHWLAGLLRCFFLLVFLVLIFLTFVFLTIVLFAIIVITATTSLALRAGLYLFLFIIRQEFFLLRRLGFRVRNCTEESARHSGKSWRLPVSLLLCHQAFFSSTSPPTIVLIT